MKIIVVEGPDNSGKTTLAMTLAKRWRAAFVKVERPEAGVQLMPFHNILKVAAAYSGITICDRHVAISEPIYANILRGGHNLKQVEIAWCLSQVHSIIYCRPTTDVIMRTLDAREQMDGVLTNALKIVHAYDDLFGEWPGRPMPPIIFHDYTRPHPLLDSITRETILK